MGVQFIDGADYITTAVWPTASGGTPWDLIYGSPSVGAAFARTSVNGYGTANSGMRKNLSENIATVIAGAAFKVSNVTGYIMRFDITGNVQGGVRVNSTGTISYVTQYGTTFGPSTYQLPFNQFHFIECQVTFATASGTVNVWVDGNLILAATGTLVNPNNIGSNYCNQVFFGNDDNITRSAVAVDDIYILDNTGPAPWNARLGDVEISAFVPTGIGSFSQFTPVGKANNWQNAAPIPSKAYSFYNQSSVSGSRDSFNYGITAPAGSGPIIAVMVMALAQTDSAGTRSLELSASQAGTDAFSPAINLGVGFIYIDSGGWIMETDVNGNSWTIANLSATEFGYEVSS